MLGTAFADSGAKLPEPTERSEQLLEELRETIVPSFADTGLKGQHYRNYPQVASLKESLELLSAQIERNAWRTNGAILAYEKEFDPFATSYAVQVSLALDWKLLGTLLFTYHERMTDALRKNLLFSCETDAQGQCTATVAFADFDALLWLDNETDWFAARNTYYYLNTIYDDDGKQRLLTGFVMPQEKLETLAFPLDAVWYRQIKTTWLRARDGGVRKHTGMDIRCAHGSPIYACAGGVVNSVGYHVKGGYYVSVVDDDGYEYFYYHMKKDSRIVERGQRVETGEQLGLSGNTGNSAAPHLHLSVITPDRRFVDPFQIYYRWVYQKTGVLVKRPG